MQELAIGQEDQKGRRKNKLITNSSLRQWCTSMLKGGTSDKRILGTKDGYVNIEYDAGFAARLRKWKSKDINNHV